MSRQIILLSALMVLVMGTSAFGQTITVPDVLKLKPQWKKLADEGRKLNFEGRFNGRTGDSFRVEKLDVEFRLPGSIRLPDRMRERQRMDITGKFAVNGQRMTFLVSELTIRETDLERLAKRVEAVPKDEPDALLALADDFAEIAEFYGDDALSAELEDIRLNSVQLMRQMASGDVSRLAKVADVAKAQQVNNTFLQSIGYEILLTQWKARTDSSELVKSVQQLTGWDKPEVEVPDRLKQGFPKDAVTLYDEGNVRDREILHRLLYRTVRGEQLQAMLKPDGSNGLELAGLVRDELPEEVTMAASFEQREVDYRLGRISELSRREMQQLLELLNGLKRSDGQDAIMPSSDIRNHLVQPSKGKSRLSPARLPAYAAIVSIGRGGGAEEDATAAVAKQVSQLLPWAAREGAEEDAAAAVATSQDRRSSGDPVALFLTSLFFI